MAQDQLKYHATFCTRIEAFNLPTSYKYDLVWIQYVAQYLDDHTLATFLCKASKNLRAGGIVMLWENLTD